MIDKKQYDDFLKENLPSAIAVICVTLAHDGQCSIILTGHVRDKVFLKEMINSRIRSEIQEGFQLKKSAPLTICDPSE